MRIHACNDPPFASMTTDSERYDRQIRVWGAEAQARLQNAKVLICGMQNLNIEVVKNLVLAGVNVTIQDDHNVCEGDFTNNFFLTSNCIGQNIIEATLPNIKALNAYIQLDFISQPLSQLSDEYFYGFQVISVAGGDENQAKRINDLCRHKQILFFWSDSHGENGIFFSDFGEHYQYKEDPKTGPNINTSSNEDSTSNNEKPVATLKQISFPSLTTVLNAKWATITSRFFPLSKIYVQFRLLHSYRAQFDCNPTPNDLNALKELYSHLLVNHDLADPAVQEQAAYREGLLTTDLDFLAICQSLDAKISYGLITTVSVLGSVLTQEIIKGISLTGIPGFNVFVFDGATYSVKAIPVK